MKQYLMDKHQWNEKTWRTINFATVKTQPQPLKTTERSKRFKFMHNLQSLGARKQQMNTHALENDIGLCPCCRVSTETQLHLITCDKNPNRQQAMLELHTGGSKYKESHNFVQLMTDCIDQWLTQPNSPPRPQYPEHNIKNPYDQSPKQHMRHILQQAIEEQTRIGWIHLFRGYQSTKWRKLAESHMTETTAHPRPDDGNRRLSTIQHRINEFVTILWQGRNQALHNSAQEDTKQFHSLESAEIRHFFTQPHLLAVQDRHYCNGTLNQLLRQRPAHRRRPLATAGSKGTGGTNTRPTKTSTDNSILQKKATNFAGSNK
jgi:hypothetical protein